MPETSYLKNISKILSGSLASQIIVIASTPIITRLYQPDTFGMLSFIASIATLSSVFFTLRYNQAIVVAKTDRQSYELIRICMIISLGFFLLLSLIVIGVHDQLMFFFQTLRDTSYLVYFIPIMALVMALFEVVKAVVTRNNKYGTLALSIFSSTLSSVGLKIITGLMFGGHALFLLVGNLFGAVIGIVLCVCAVHHLLWKSLSSHLSIKRMIAMLVLFSDFPKYSILNGFFNKAGKLLPIIVLGYYYSASVVGLFAMAYSLMRMGSGVIGESFRKVYIREASRLIHKDKFKAVLRLFLMDTSILLSIGIAMMFTIVLLGPEIFGDFLGAKWQETGVFAQMLTPWLIFFVASPVWTGVYVVLRKQKLLMHYQIIAFILRLFALLGGASFGDVYWAVGCFSIISAFSLMFIGIMAYVLLRSKTVVYR